MKKAKGTHKSMGTTSGYSTGLESGIAEKMAFKAGQGVEITSGSQRPKAVKGDSIAMK